MFDGEPCGGEFDFPPDVIDAVGKAGVRDAGIARGEGSGDLLSVDPNGEARLPGGAPHIPLSPEHGGEVGSQGGIELHGFGGAGQAGGVVEFAGDGPAAELVVAKFAVDGVCLVVESGDVEGVDTEESRILEDLGKPKFHDPVAALNSREIGRIGKVVAGLQAFRENEMGLVQHHALDASAGEVDVRAVGREDLAEPQSLEVKNLVERRGQALVVEVVSEGVIEFDAGKVGDVRANGKDQNVCRQEGRDDKEQGKIRGEAGHGRDYTAPGVGVIESAR